MTIVSLHHLTEPSRGPNITNITEVTSTSMKVLWQMLSNQIQEYAVCFKASNNLSDIDCILNKTVNDSSARDVVLLGLNPATTYSVAVKARNQAGFGELGPAMTKKTLEASKQYKIIITFK